MLFIQVIQTCYSGMLFIQVIQKSYSYKSFRQVIQTILFFFKELMSYILAGRPRGSWLCQAPYLVLWTMPPWTLTLVMNELTMGGCFNTKLGHGWSKLIFQNFKKSLKVFGNKFLGLRKNEIRKIKNLRTLSKTTALR